ncbi:Crp/Fnr family transcriptional regulator [Methylorubrum populi]|uniref:Thioredoxin reductase n=1 Tax=Methylorubrum populi TaxID=223967 RepID=A0A833IZP1_9HYPH|nr:cyclic nucleotide-binding domain-containing protein [Methylorubrum populi]KAB7781833.1 Thioredoxin reductase [Methylorubrum populi]
MSMIDSCRDQMFPKLSPAEIGRLHRFGQEQHYAAGDALFVTGDISPGMFVLVSGSVEVRRHDPLGHLAPITTQDAGEFVAEVGQLAGRAALVDVVAVNDLDTILIPSENLRVLLIAEAELGDRIMRALILRRVALIVTLPPVCPRS